MIRHRRPLLSAAFALLAVIVLAGCAPGGEVAPTATASAPASAVPSSAAPSDAPTPEPLAPVELPTDCAALASDATRQEAVGDMTLQSNGEGFVRPAPDGSTLALGCDWIVGDATGMLLLISTADAAAVTTAAEALPAQGYTCQPAEDFGATFCAKPGAGEDTEEMIVAREGVWIYLSTANRNGRAFLSEIVQGIFG